MPVAVELRTHKSSLKRWRGRVLSPDNTWSEMERDKVKKVSIVPFPSDSFYKKTIRAAIVKR